MEDDDQYRLMSSVARQARILDRITADLLTAAQIQRGTLRVDLQVVDPRTIVEGVVEGRFDVDVVVDDDRSVRADPLRLEQMLTNLLSNAHKYGAAPFTCASGPMPTPRRLAIDVIDHGEGVPEEFQAHLFREFARAHGSGRHGHRPGPVRRAHARAGPERRRGLRRGSRGRLGLHHHDGGLLISCPDRRNTVRNSRPLPCGAWPWTGTTTTQCSSTSTG